VYDVVLAESSINVKTKITPDPEAYLAFAGFLRGISNSGPKKKKWFSWIYK
jgi:hypothetical protein